MESNEDQVEHLLLEQQVSNYSYVGFCHCTFRFGQFRGSARSMDGMGSKSTDP